MYYQQKLLKGQPAFSNIRSIDPYSENCIDRHDFKQDYCEEKIGQKCSVPLVDQDPAC